MNPVLWMLIGATVATVGLLFERRARSRQVSLDDWAGERRRPVLRDVDLSILAEVEPIALLPDVVSIERFLPARAETEAALFLCQCGRGHKPRSVLLAVISAPDFLPHLRILPKTEKDVPSHLGYVEKESSALPLSYRLEAFSDLDPALVYTVASALPRAGEPISVELRPGRILIAHSRVDGEGASELLAHSEALVSALLTLRPAGPVA